MYWFSNSFPKKCVSEKKVAIFFFIRLYILIHKYKSMWLMKCNLLFFIINLIKKLSLVTSRIRVKKTSRYSKQKKCLIFWHVNQIRRLFYACHLPVQAKECSLYDVNFSQFPLYFTSFSPTIIRRVFAFFLSPKKSVYGSSNHEYELFVAVQQDYSLNFHLTSCVSLVAKYSLTNLTTSIPHSTSLELDR